MTFTLIRYAKITPHPPTVRGHLWYKKTYKKGYTPTRLLVYLGEKQTSPEQKNTKKSGVKQLCIPHWDALPPTFWCSAKRGRMPEPHNQASSFGDWLRRQRKTRDWTQAELAQRVGCAIIT